MNLQRLLLVASSSLACAASKFTITPGTTQAATSTVDNVKFVKQWTLTAATTTDLINSIDLDLAGRVYVSYRSGLPTGVLGYVNVSGDSQTVVDAVGVAHDDANDNDNDDNDDENEANDPDGDLNVHINSNASASLTGYLLTEVILASTGIVMDLQSKRSAVVVVEDGVLMTSSTTAELQVEASGSSAIFVSAADAAVSMRQLQLDASGSASLQFEVASVSVSNEAQVDAQGSGQVVVLVPTVEAAMLEIDTENTGAICFSGQQVTATTYEGKDESRISMPNAADKHGSTGTAPCEKATVPPREPACVGTGCASGTSTTPGAAGTSTTPGAAGTATTPGAAGGNNAGISASDGTSASSTPQLAVLVAFAAVGIAMATLL
uniref:Auto-transporter adhesin head GIN domain-containing protein n=1 Tax=Hyaloperonospora arabidopsidis (strain Emoy2) TaxID=559515 RepID=M4C0D1_HYAAE